MVATLKSMKQVPEYKRTRQTAKICKDQLKKRDFVSSKAIKYPIYVKDAAEVFRSQVCKASLNDMVTKSIPENVFLHPVNLLIGTEMITAGKC